MDGLARSNIALNRKMLAELAVSEPFSFQALVSEVRKVLPFLISTRPNIDFWCGDVWTQVEGIKFRDTNANRLTKADYVKYEPVQLPPGFEMAPNQHELNIKSVPLFTFAIFGLLMFRNFCSRFLRQFVLLSHSSTRHYKTLIRHKRRLTKSTLNL